MHAHVALLFLSPLLASCAAGAPLSFLVTRTLTDDAVLQYGKPSRVWGWSSVGSNVTGCLDVNVTCVTALAGADGLWVVEFPAQPAGGPHALSFLDGESGAAAWYLGVLFGDVFVCGGQSNMDLPTSYIVNASQEIAAANAFPSVRLLSVPIRAYMYSATSAPLAEFIAISSWMIASNTTVAGFSAECWLFAK